MWAIGSTNVKMREGRFACFPASARACGRALESELGEGGLSWSAQRFFGDVRSVAGKLGGDNQDSIFKLGEELHAPVASLVFAPALVDKLAAVSKFARELTVVAHADGCFDADAGDVGESLVDGTEVKPFFAASSCLDCRVNVALGDVHVCSPRCLTGWLVGSTIARARQARALERFRVRVGRGWVPRQRRRKRQRSCILPLSCMGVRRCRARPPRR